VEEMTRIISIRYLDLEEIVTLTYSTHNKRRDKTLLIEKIDPLIIKTIDQMRRKTILSALSLIYLLLRRGH
jgi:hypothetical protein